MTTNATNTSLPIVLLPSGDRALITSVGKLQLSSNLHLKNVLCVPTFKVYLLSVSKITRDLNCSVTFYPSWCVL